MKSSIVLDFDIWNSGIKLDQYKNIEINLVILNI